jgi:type II secretory pathway pseudopilin PulG
MNPNNSRDPGGFTRLELIVLLAISIILLRLLFPTVGRFQPSKERRARTALREIVHAAEQFYQDYSEYPAVDPNRNPDVDSACGDPAALMELPNSRLFNILRALDQSPNIGHGLNPRRQNYIETKMVNDPSSPRDGFLEVASNGWETGSFYDPWGCQYNIVLDTSRDHTIQVGKYYADFANERSPQTGVGAFSLGKDKKLGSHGDRILVKNGTLSDDLVSWLHPSISNPPPAKSP